MQLLDIVKPIEQMTDEELAEKLRRVRHNRDFVKPSSRAIVKRAAKKASNKKVSSADKLIDSLTPEEKRALIMQLSQGTLPI